MIPVEILKETGMSLTEQRKQPASFIELITLDIKIGREVEQEANERAKHS